MVRSTIAVVDDHPVVLEGLANLLNQLPDLELIHRCADALEAIQLLRKQPVELVITDINLFDINGIELCRRIKQEFSQIRVIGMSTFHEPRYVSELLQAGGSGFITKNASMGEMEKVIRSALRGEVYISPLLADQKPLQFAQTEVPVLTRREKEVLQLIARGLTNKEIAQALFVSLNTVDSHRKNLMHKFEVMNAASLIAKASRLGVVKD